ncbi:hypothetical protein ANCCAN_16276 [Ancylostoma caninum]|uniref:Uncharacterized protein n=1 Tax=Ancylostoma caninum TaxID=29170 RepID=A0A368G0D9_ANCCA|nr:hypothetical protein ANCCAN_16276 [Ancylostoma caninum]
MNRTAAFVLLLYFLQVDGQQEYEERRKFHDWLCQKRPSLSSCSSPYTMAVYKQEMAAHSEKSGLRKQARAMGLKNTVRRDSGWWEDSDEDEDYEYYLWRKYRRQKMRRRLLENSRQVLFPTNYFLCYPSYGYGGGYPYYSGYGGYGGGYGGYGGGLLGGLFRIGAGRHIGISTPIGGFGYSSGFGIGIG